MSDTAIAAMAARPLHELANVIRRDWTKPYYGAVPYLNAMGDLSTVRDNYGADSGESVVRYFLSNATAWRGETARTVKAALKAMLKAA